MKPSTNILRFPAAFANARRAFLRTLGDALPLLRRAVDEDNAVLARTVVEALAVLAQGGDPSDLLHAIKLADAPVVSMAAERARRMCAKE